MLAVEKIILIVIFLIILLITFYLLFGLGKGAADQLLLQHELRQCCSRYLAYNCTEPIIIFCNDDTIDSVRVKLGLSDVQLNESCGCPT